MAAASSKPPSADDPLIGQVISERYKVLAKLGEGGMGRVYLTEHVLIQKKMALKVLDGEFAQREELAARFLQEARAASSIGQENVIDISDFGRTPDGLVFFAMEYLDGVDLGATLRQSGALPWSRLKPIVLQICKALKAAHAQGIVHRDLKPENIFLLRKEGRPDFVKLLDFGIAKVADATSKDSGPRLTRTGVIFGTPEYMAPEQAEGKSADQRADIYAVGCVIYQGLTGSPPFHADSFMALLTKHLVEPLVPPSVRRPDLHITRDLDRLVIRALEKDRERRFQSVDELMQTINGRLDESSAVTKPLGGSDALAAIRPAASGSATEAFPAEAYAMDGPRPRSGRGRPVKLLMVLSGLVLGVAAWLLLSNNRVGRTVETPPVTVAPPGVPGAAVPTPADPVAPPAPPPPIAGVQETDPANPPPAALEGEPPPTSKRPPQRRERRRDPPAPTPESKSPPLDVELKPFPQ
jgi:eukaryotic-like serine/threonine-protein kinase